MIDMVRKRIDNIWRKHKCKNRSYRKHVLREKIDHLKEFQKHLVLVPADKAKNNVLIVCKQYYLDVVTREFCNVDNTGPRIYNKYNGNVEKLVEEHVDYMAVNNIRIPSDMAQLPQLYWLPQMLKQPIGSRFMAASDSCITKPLSKLLTTCLQLILQHYKEYNKGIVRNTGATI